jgi:hypothetical protein
LTVNNIELLTPTAADHEEIGAKQYFEPSARVIMEEDSGFSNLFYIMLVLGIIGIIGFLVVAAGAAAGSM